jgi:hypothetical protein
MTSMGSKLLHVIKRKLQYQVFLKAQVCLLQQIVFRVYINVSRLIRKDNYCT